jgi:hypothetical protein
MDPREYLLDMHAKAVTYHTHFSAMRTGTSSILIPLTIAIIVTGYFQYPQKGFLLLIVACVMIIGLIYVNFFFTKWSIYCRRIERLYEELIQFLENNSPPAVGPRFFAQLGFRHLISSLISRRRTGELRKINDDLTKYVIPPLKRAKVADYFNDPFLCIVSVFSTLLLIFFAAEVVISHYRSKTAPHSADEIHLREIMRTDPFAQGQFVLPSGNAPTLADFARSHLCKDSLVSEQPVFVVGSSDNVEVRARGGTADSRRIYDSNVQLAHQRAVSVAQVLKRACPNISVLPLATGPWYNPQVQPAGTSHEHPDDRVVRIWRLDLARNTRD